MGLGLPEDRPDGLDSPVTARIIKHMARAQVRVFRLTNGRIGSRWRIGAGFRKPVPTLLLDHVGRRSGRTFTTPLLYLEDGPDLVVVASQGGLPKNPAWYLNLTADPKVVVEVGRERLDLVARTASDAERAELWPRLVGMYADFATYDSWTERTIPVVICE